MSKTREEQGGSAFPNGDRTIFSQPEPGMTLRDWFAGQALMGFLAAGECGSGWADDAYEMADAMLKAREK
jgi:hypothetical protein